MKRVATGVVAGLLILTLGLCLTHGEALPDDASPALAAHGGCAVAFVAAPTVTGFWAPALAEALTTSDEPSHLPLRAASLFQPPERFS